MAFPVSASGVRGAVVALSAVAALAACFPPRDVLQPLTAEVWTGWEDLGGDLGAPACAASNTSRIDCFAWERAAAPSVARRQWNGTAWSSSSLGGIALAYDPAGPSRPECVSRGPDQIDCFVRREPDRLLFRRTMQGGYTGGYEALYGPVVKGAVSGLASDPSCVSETAGTIDCFAAGVDGQLHQIHFDGVLWGPWTPRGGQIYAGTKPSCVVYRGGAHCITVRTDRSLQLHRFTATGQSVVPTVAVVASPANYAEPSPRCVASPGAGLGNDRIQCFVPTDVVNAGLHLSRLVFDGRNWSAISMGPVPRGNGYDWDCVASAGERVDCVDVTRQPDPASPGTNRAIAVAFRHVQLSYAMDYSWGNVPLAPVAGGIPGFVRCARWGADRLDCFASGSWDGPTRMWHASLAMGTVVPDRPRPRPLP